MRLIGTAALEPLESVPGDPQDRARVTNCARVACRIRTPVLALRSLVQFVDSCTPSREPDGAVPQGWRLLRVRDPAVPLGGLGCDGAPQSAWKRWKVALWLSERVEKTAAACGRATLVERTYSRYLEQRSDAAVVQLRDADDTRTRQGRRWTAQSVARVLTNPVYAGYITLGEELHDSEHQALIARERFDQVQALRRSPDTTPQARGRNPDYLLRGLLHCPCGYSLTKASTRRGRLVHRYYRCIAKDKQEKGSRIRTLRAAPPED